MIPLWSATVFIKWIATTFLIYFGICALIVIVNEIWNRIDGSR